jgi:asparagine synthase (glutamine-hydrolysing)
MDLLTSAALDREYLADYLMLPNSIRSEIRTERTVYEGINRVLPGTSFVASVPNKSVKRLVHWDWRDQMRRFPLDDPADVGPHYGQLLRDAVRERLVGRTGAHLSGGMDSTAVALIAKELLDTEARGDRLETFSLIYNNTSYISQESLSLGKLLDRQTGIVAHRIPADDLLAFTEFFRPPPHDEPWPWLFWSENERSLAKAASCEGITNLLTGHGADDMAVVLPHHITTLLKHGRVRDARQEAANWGAALNRNWWSVLFEFGMANLLPSGLRSGLYPLFHGGYSRWRDMGPYTIPPWIRPQFAKQYSLNQRARKNIQEMYMNHEITGVSVALSAISERCGDPCRWYYAVPEGVVTAHPFLDTRLLCYCLNYHSQAHEVPERHKPVLAQAMRGLLPEDIRLVGQKKAFNEPIHRGLAKSFNSLVKLINSMSPLSDDMIDGSILLQCLQSAVLGIGKSASVLSRLHLTLALLQWMSCDKGWRSDRLAVWQSHRIYLHEPT